MRASMGCLKTRLDELDAAQCMEDMRHLPGHWEALRGEHKGQFSCRLAGGMRLVIAPKRREVTVLRRLRNSQGVWWSQGQKSRRFSTCSLTNLC